MNQKLLRELKAKSKIALQKNTRFHDYGHALEVLKNTKKIISLEKGHFDQDILFAVALFHDVSNRNDELEGQDGATITQKYLNQIKSFPLEKIPDVQRIIISISGNASSMDEIIINEADRMAIFSKLSLCRAFMINGHKELQLYEAIKNFLEFIDKKYTRFQLKSAQKLAKNDYLFMKKFLQDCLVFYK